MAVWFDIDNSPHVPLFYPIIIALKREGINVVITARNYAQTIPLLKKYKIEFIRVDGYSGKNKFAKVNQTLLRAYKLIKIVKNYDVKLLVNHGARAAILAASILKKKIISGFDYENTELFILNRFSDIVLVPQVLKPRLYSSKYRYYNGLKEEVYLCDFMPDPYFINKLPFLNYSKPLIVLRPPAITANYFNKKSLELFIKLIKYLKQLDCNIIYLSRVNYDKKIVVEMGLDVFIPPEPLDGQNLVFYADAVISGGGTMLREAALLGTKSYSIFGSKPAEIDLQLMREGKLNFIKSEEDLYKLDFSKQDKKRNIILKSDVKNIIINVIKENL